MCSWASGHLSFLVAVDTQRKFHRPVREVHLEIRFFVSANNGRRAAWTWLLRWTLKIPIYAVFPPLHHSANCVSIFVRREIWRSRFKFQASWERKVSCVASLFHLSLPLHQHIVMNHRDPLCLAFVFKHLMRLWIDPQGISLICGSKNMKINHIRWC